MKPEILTSFDYPPIPVRSFDWSAMRRGYEPPDPIGYGKTKEAAIADLLQQELEQEEEA